MLPLPDHPLRHTPYATQGEGRTPHTGPVLDSWGSLAVARRGSEQEEVWAGPTGHFAGLSPATTGSEADSMVQAAGGTYAGAVEKARKKGKVSSPYTGVFRRGTSYLVKFEKTGWTNAKQCYTIVVGTFESAKAGCLARILALEWISSL